MNSMEKCMSRAFPRWASRWVVGLAFGVFAATAFAPGAAAQRAAKPAAKDNRKAAFEAYSKAEKAFAIGDYAAALEHFETADALIPTPQTQFWIARSLDELDRRTDAIAAYRKLMDNPDAERVGAEKLDTAKQRLAELEAKEAAAAAAATPSTEPQDTEPEARPESTPPEPVPTIEPPVTERRSRDRYTPQSGLVELGLFGGALFVSRDHNLHEERFTRQAYDHPAWLGGLRVAYFPHGSIGFEAEYAHGFGELDDASSAQFNTARGHIIVQPKWRLTPFVLLGAGVLHATSDQGSDADFMGEAGVGLKFAITEWLTPRADFRVDMGQRQGGGVAFSQEALLGLSFVLGR
jgi:hypothetical protein